MAIFIRYIRYSTYVILTGVFAYGLTAIFQPSRAEVEEMKKKYNNPHYSAYNQVLRAASDPNSKPIYRQKPGEQHPLPKLASAEKNE